MSEAPILVDFRKWPDSRHWQYSMFDLAEDEHGRWLWAPPGITAQRGEDPAITWDFPGVKLITQDWYSAIWSCALETPEQWRVYVDIVAPAEWHEGSVRMVDLDLDVYRSTDGKVRILDEDEFAEHQLKLKYPEHLISGAREAADRLLRMVSDEVEPFGRAGQRRLLEALERSRP